MKDFPNSSWVEKQLGEVVTVTKTKGGSRPLPYVGLEDISSGGRGNFTGSLEPQGDKSTTFEFGPKHLLYGRLRPYLNKVYRPSFEGHCSSEIFPMLPNDYLDRGYLFHWITSEQIVDKINATSTGARMPRANVKEILRFPIPLPPLEEQQRIVAVLDEAFEGLARARAHTEANLQNARELLAVCLDEIFGSNDPSWKTESLSELCVIGDGNHSSKYPKNSEMVTEGVPFLRSSNIQNGEIDQNEMLYISEVKHAELKKGHLKNGDVLFTNRGEIGKVAIVPEDLEGANLNSQVAWLRCGDRIDHWFLFYFLQSGRIKQHYLDTQSGAALQQFTIKMLKAVSVRFPPRDDQEAAVHRIRKIQNEISVLESAYRATAHDLDDLRQSLLQKAFAGELT